MAGTETARFDLVMQFSEDAYQDLMGVFFDADGLITKIVDLIPGVDGEDFTVSLSLDRPDVPLEGSGENPIDIRLGLGAGGSLATLRMVVGINVDRVTDADGEKDRIQIDFKNSLYFARVTLANNVPVPIPNLRAKLQEILPALPILPVPVKRDTTSATQIKRADFRIVDDRSGEDRDATAAMLTFGGGEAADAGSLRSFVPPGSRGAVGIFFRWLTRIAAPRIETAMGLPAGSFTLADDRCSLNRTVMVGDDKDVELRSLTLSLADGFIDIAAGVAKSGFCYEATGTVGARLRLEIVDGRLVASAEIGDPDVDIDIPWYCWLAAAVIGAVIGGILLGVIGAIVGAVLVPLIMWLAVDVVEGTIDRVMDEIKDAINGALPNIDVPAFGINFLFQKVFIDDVVIQAEMQVEDHSPVRVEGLALLRPGQGLDLDNGRIGGPDFAESDVRWQGAGERRLLETGCQADLARTGSRSFDAIPKYRLYGYSYEPRGKVLLHELGVINPLASIDLPFPFPGGGIFDDDVFEHRYVYAVKTNEGRYALVQAVEVQDDYVRLRYKTYERNVPAVSLTGDFTCERKFLATPDHARVVFEPARVAQLATAQVANAAGVATPAPINHARFTARGCEHKETPRPAECGNVFQLPPLPEGSWVSHFEAPLSARARIEAHSSGTRGKVSYLWTLGGTKLEDGSSGQVEVSGVAVSYKVAGKCLLLTVDPAKVVELFVRVTVIDDSGCSVSAAKCLHHDGRCPTRARHVPTLTQFQDLMALPPALVQTGAVTLVEGAVYPRPDRPLATAR